MKHYDCIYYLNSDVFKGICKRDKNFINADDAACEHLSMLRNVSIVQILHSPLLTWEHA